MAGAPTKGGAERADVFSFELTQDELHLLWATQSLEATDESPLGPFEALEDAGALEAAAKSLVAKRLADPKKLRPDRELLRRLLIASRPDSRIVLMSAGPDGGRRELDIYERAGAFLPYKKEGQKHRFDPPIEAEEVVARIQSRFRPRRSTGDFLNITLGATEYFAFSLLASDLAGRVPPLPPPLVTHGSEGPTQRNMQLAEAGLETPLSARYADDGTPIHRLLARLHREVSSKSLVPSSHDWDLALASLIAKGLAIQIEDRFVLRAFLQDLAVGLATKRRTVLTRFDFGEEDWMVRDATFVAVPGSLFLVRPAREGGIQIAELDASSLLSTLRLTIETIGHKDTISS